MPESGERRHTETKHGEQKIMSERLVPEGQVNYVTAIGD